MPQTRVTSLTKRRQKTLYEFLHQWKGQNPKDKRKTASEEWKKLFDPKSKKNRLLEIIEQVKNGWAEILHKTDIPKMTRIFLGEFLTENREKTRTETNTKSVEPDKRRVFRAVHRATPLGHWDLPTPNGSTLVGQTPQCHKLKAVPFKYEA